jgi:hypothetical protein
MFRNRFIRLRTAAPGESARTSTERFVAPRPGGGVLVTPSIALYKRANHVSRDVLCVTQRRFPARPAVSTASATRPSIPHRVVRARTGTIVLVDGRRDHLILDCSKLFRSEPRHVDFDDRRSAARLGLVETLEPLGRFDFRVLVGPVRRLVASILGFWQLHDPRDRRGCRSNFASRPRRSDRNRNVRSCRARCVETLRGRRAARPAKHAEQTDTERDASSAMIGAEHNH